MKKKEDVSKLISDLFDLMKEENEHRFNKKNKKA